MIDRDPVKKLLRSIGRHSAVATTLAAMAMACGSSTPDGQGASAGAAGMKSQGGGAGGSGGAITAGAASATSAAGNSGQGGTAGMSAAGTGGGGAAGAASGGAAGVGGTATAGSGGTAGASGGSGGGGGHGGGTASCATSNRLICEDFESTATGAIPTGWTKQGDIQVASDDSHGGGHSLKLFVTQGVGENYRSINMNPSKLGASHWGRVYYKVQAPVPSYFAHDTFIALTGNGPDSGFNNENVRVVDTVHNADGSHQFLYNVQPSGNEFGKGSDYSYNFNDGKWHCAEWHIDAGNQSYHFYYDNTEITSIAIDNGAGQNKNSEIPSAFSNLSVGIAQYQNPPSDYKGTPVWFTAWIDDLALDTNRIGCD